MEQCADPPSRPVATRSSPQPLLPTGFRSRVLPCPATQRREPKYRSDFERPFSLLPWETAGFGPAAQNLSHAPCLGNTTPWYKRLCRIANFAYRTYASFIEMSNKPFQGCSYGFPAIRIQGEIRIDKRSDQPWPDGTLMVRGIPRAQIAEIFGFVIGMIRGQGSQAYRS